MVISIAVCVWVPLSRCVLRVNTFLHQRLRDNSLCFPCSRGLGVRANLISTLILFVPNKLNQNQLNLEFEKKVTSDKADVRKRQSIGQSEPVPRTARFSISITYDHLFYEWKEMKKCPLEEKRVSGKLNFFVCWWCVCVHVYVCVCAGPSKSPGQKPGLHNPSSAFLKVLSPRRANPISFNVRLLRTADFISACVHTHTHVPSSCPSALPTSPFFSLNHVCSLPFSPYLCLLILHPPHILIYPPPPSPPPPPFLYTFFALVPLDVWTTL